MENREDTPFDSARAVSQNDHEEPTVLPQSGQTPPIAPPYVTYAGPQFYQQNPAASAAAAFPEGKRCAVCGEIGADRCRMAGETYVCRLCCTDPKRFCRVNRRDHGDNMDDWTHLTCAFCGKEIRSMECGIMDGKLLCSECRSMFSQTVYAGPAYFNPKPQPAAIGVAFVPQYVQPETSAGTPSFVCPSCGNALKSASPFCPECGAKLDTMCKCCGANGQSGKFCNECGAVMHA